MRRGGARRGAARLADGGRADASSHLSAGDSRITLTYALIACAQCEHCVPSAPLFAQARQPAGLEISDGESAVRRVAAGLFATTWRLYAEPRRSAATGDAGGRRWQAVAAPRSATPQSDVRPRLIAHPKTQDFCKLKTGKNICFKYFLQKKGI